MSTLVFGMHREMVASRKLGGVVQMTSIIYSIFCFPHLALKSYLNETTLHLPKNGHCKALNRYLPVIPATKPTGIY